EQRRAQFADARQNLPDTAEAAPAEKYAGAGVQTQTAESFYEPLDPALSPENINALLLAMQTQQPSLDTRLLLNSSAASPGGKTMIDYLTDPDTVANAANDDNMSPTLSVQS